MESYPDLPNAFIDPISLEPFDDPVIAEDNMSKQMLLLFSF